ncbi:MAG: hypothetical protein WDW38_005579 [Sanguina aurantia]
MGGVKASAALFEQLGNALKTEAADFTKKIKGLVVFKIDDTTWVLDLKEGGRGEVYQGPVKDNESADLTLTISDTDFVRLVMGKISAQQAFLMRKLKITGSMGMAMKLTPVLEAAQPKGKL